MSSHLPNRTIAQYGTTRNPWRIGTVPSASCGMAFATRCAESIASFLVTACRRAHPDEVQVVRVVAERIHPLRAALGDVVLVRFRGGDVRRDDVRVAADALINVGRHVDDVAGAGHEGEQAIRFGFGALGRVGSFPEMDPQV